MEDGAGQGDRQDQVGAHGDTGVEEQPLEMCFSLRRASGGDGEAGQLRVSKEETSSGGYSG